jgi:hypothetical protein
MKNWKENTEKELLLFLEEEEKKEVTKNKLHEKLIYVYYQVKEMNNKV